MGEQDESGHGNRFEPLAHPLRMAILEALFDAFRESPTESDVRFADLRKRVGATDSGNFTYHLGQLTGTYVAETGSGYRLTRRGHQVGVALLSDLHEQRESIEDIENCPYCESSFDVTFDDGMLELRCSNGHRFETTIPARVVDVRNEEELRCVVAMEAYQMSQQALDGTCSNCYGTIDGKLTQPEELDGYLFVDRCPGCGYTLAFPVGHCVVHHPDVLQFLVDRGVDPRTTPLMGFPFCRPSQDEVVSTDPLRVRVNIELEGEKLSATVDQSGSVRTVARKW